MSDNTTTPPIMGLSNAAYDAKVRREYTERQFSTVVEGLLRSYGWTWYHTYRSDRSNPGWPDYVATRPGVYDDGRLARVVFLELKTVTGRVSPAQHTWLAALHAAGLECGVVRPTDIDRLIEVLGPKRAPMSYPEWS